MNILIIDSNTEAQVECAHKFHDFPQEDLEVISPQVKLVNENGYLGFIYMSDVVILGPTLGDKAFNIARSIKAEEPGTHIIMFVKDEYSGSLIRNAHHVGIRKVLPIWSAQLDLLQELVGIQSEFRREGKVVNGKVVLVSSPKGGAGVTSLVAALGEVASRYDQRTMLWDMDIDTRDLCRSLSVFSTGGRILNKWVQGELQVSKESLTEALFPVHNRVSVLMPPDGMRESLDYLCNLDTLEVVERIMEVSRTIFDNIIIDVGGAVGPAIGLLKHYCDEIVVVTGECPLSVTAAEFNIANMVHNLGNANKLRIQLCGSGITHKDLKAQLEPTLKLGNKAWTLPPLIDDPRVGHWPASGRTVYSLGSKITRKALQDIAFELGLAGGELLEDAGSNAPSRNWFAKTTDDSVLTLDGGIRTSIARLPFVNGSTAANKDEEANGVAPEDEARYAEQELVRGTRLTGSAS